MYAAVGRGQLFCVVRPAWPRFLQFALYSGLNLNQDKATKPQTVQIVRQGEATPYWFKFNPLYLFFVLRLGQAAGARMLFSVGGYGGFFNFDARLPLAAAVDVVALVNLLQASVRSNAVMRGVVDGCAGFSINN